MNNQTVAQGNSIFAPIRNLWLRVSPSIVPVLAVLSALILTIPFMVATGGRGDVSKGLQIAFNAYAAFIEGSVGIAINDMLTVNDTALVLQLSEYMEQAEGDALDERDLRALARNIDRIVAAGADEVLQYGDTLNRYADTLDAETLSALSERLPGIREVTPDTLREIQPFVGNLAAIEIGAASDLIREYAPEETLTDEQFTDIQSRVEVPAEQSAENTLRYFKIINNAGSVRTIQAQLAQLDVLEELGIDPFSNDASNIIAISSFAAGSSTGADIVNELIATEMLLNEAGITDLERLASQLGVVNNMYQNDILNDSDVVNALRNELPPFIENNFVVYRPGNQSILVNPGTTEPVGIINRTVNNPDGENYEVPDVAYARLGGKALLFFPFNLERMLVTMIPYVIAGLAVALGFKAGLFNIGAEGQLYMGSIIAVWIGYSPIFDTLPGALRMLLVLLGGVVGGGLWGMIPGALKAFTGAHEVINTIMLNLIAIRFVDWLIRSTDPVIMLDPTSSTPRTPFVSPTAVLPRFNEVSTAWFIAAGVAFAVYMLWTRRKAISQNAAAAIRPILLGTLVVLGGLFFSWLTVNNQLHIGLVIMILTVWFVDWFLNSTTLGYELKTVGANPAAARYAGMNVKWNIIFAMTFSGLLAGIAGAIEISSVELKMQPAFFSGLGFDAIAVALLARNNPRNLIPAGLLWASLITGAGLMQVRADIANDLVKIIQALIIMFIAADAIVRYIWRVPEATEEEKAASTFSKGWGG